MTTQAARWCFTSFANELKIKTDLVKAYIYQKEKAPTTNTEHWQGYIVLNRSQRLKKVKEILGDEKCHLEVAKGNTKQNIEYCTKNESAIPNTIVKWGDLDEGNQGKRTDLESFSTFIKEYKDKCIPWEKINEEFPNVMAKYPKYVKEVVRNYKKRIIRDEDIRSDMTTLHIITGKTGTGKTSYLKTLKDVYWKTEDDKWWDGYEGQTITVFNEWTGKGQMTELDLFKLSDHAPFRVQIKGDSVQFTSKEIWISTNKRAEDILESVPVCNQDAFKRRITFYKMVDWKPVKFSKDD